MVLASQGLFTFSPIMHSHVVSKLSTNIGSDWKAWAQFNINMFQACPGLIVAQLPGWKESEGVQAEMKLASANLKPIVFWPWLEPADGPETLSQM